MFPQHTIAKISSSTVHNVNKRFRESCEITLCRWQGLTSTLKARDLWSLRWNRIKNRHLCVKDITTWASEQYRKSLSVNGVKRYLLKCNLNYCEKQKPFMNNTAGFSGFIYASWPKAHLVSFCFLPFFKFQMMWINIVEGVARFWSEVFCCWLFCVAGGWRHAGCFQCRELAH